MRTVISHFYNEEYLLPWWLEHHTKIFDFGILIDHNSTDKSVEICKAIAPHWKVVKTKLNKFDAWLTDLEVMNYENEIKGWKIALNITEFLVSNQKLEIIEDYLLKENLIGCVTSGFTMVDKEPLKKPQHNIGLIEQKPWGIPDNTTQNKLIRKILFQPKKIIHRNRFYHCLPTGMYSIGRHFSMHPHARNRCLNMLTLHYGYSPWCDDFINRKLQIGGNEPGSDKKNGWGIQHFYDKTKLEQEFLKKNKEQYVDIYAYLKRLCPSMNISNMNDQIILTRK